MTIPPFKREGLGEGDKLLNIFYVKNNRGVSLIELMVVVVILSLIILGLVTFFTGGVRSWITGQNQLSAQRNARQAMDWMVREIREADYINSSSAISQIDFNTPFDGSISYSLSGSGDLKRGISPVISNVQSLVFTYFDNSGNPVATSDTDKESKVSKVHIDLQVDVDQDNNPDITLNSDVDLRNFGLQD